MSIPRRRAVAIALVALALAASLFVLRPAGREFDARAWQAREQAHDHVAAEMADRLVAERRLRGMTRDDIVRMLGTPPQTSYFRDWALVYWLGPERGFISIDSEWLVIRFGPDQHVSDYRIVRD